MSAADLRTTNPHDLPSSLAEIHRTATTGEALRAWLPDTTAVSRTLLVDILAGAGFSLRRRESSRPTRLTRLWTLPDTVGPHMQVLVSGLNPSPAAADAGIGFARPGNRFWPAAVAAGIVSRDRDPLHALDHHGIGMTDVVKRTTRKAAELSTAEYADGLARLERMVVWLAPRAVCFVGLAGWRAVRDRTAGPGWQTDGLGGRPVYLMPSTSGLNASSTLASLTAHLEAVHRES